MKQTTFKLAQGLGVATLLVGSNLAMAETLSVPATVNVDNAIDFTVVGTLDFGIVRANAASTAGNCRIIAMAAGAAAPAITSPTGTGTGHLTDCSATGAGAALQSVGGTLARPVFTVAGLAPFTALTLTLPTAAVSLTSSGLPAGSSGFLLGNFTAYQTVGNVTGAITTTVTANNAGTATFNVGAQLATDPVLPTGLGIVYQNDADYAGAFDVTVAY